MLELHDGLRLSSGQLRLLERLFAGSSRVTVRMMHGGFSGSLVLRTDSFDWNGCAPPAVESSNHACGVWREEVCRIP